MQSWRSKCQNRPARVAYSSSCQRVGDPDVGGLAATGRERRSGTNERSSTAPARAGTIGPRTDEQCPVLAPRRFRGLCEILFRELTDTGCTRSAHGSPYARTCQSANAIGHRRCRAAALRKLKLWRAQRVSGFQAQGGRGTRFYALDFRVYSSWGGNGT